MAAAVIVIVIAAALMGSAATDGGKGITNASNTVQSAIVKAAKR